MDDERKFEDTVRKLTKMVYGDNYDHSQYENILNCLHDFENFFGNLCLNTPFWGLSLNGFRKLVKSLGTFLDDYNESHKPE